MNLTKGDVVWLKSGGPAMTVINFDSGGSTLAGDGEVRVIVGWFDKNLTYQVFGFTPEALVTEVPKPEGGKFLKRPYTPDMEGQELKSVVTDGRGQDGGEGQ